ncbi:MAG: hypothetical protein ACRD3O_09440 [Terriglobia bacterium]
MKDTELYAALLGLRPPGMIRKVRLDLGADWVGVWTEEGAGAKWGCPQCGRALSLYDQAEELEWRHFATCHCQTDLHARLPASNAPSMGFAKWRRVGQIPARRLRCAWRVG